MTQAERGSDGRFPPQTPLGSICLLIDLIIRLFLEYALGPEIRMESCTRTKLCT